MVERFKVEFDNLAGFIFGEYRVGRCSPRFCYLGVTRIERVIYCFLKCSVLSSIFGNVILNIRVVFCYTKKEFLRYIDALYNAVYN